MYYKLKIYIRIASRGDGDAVCTKENPKKVESRYKTIYLRQEIIEALEKIAQKNNTSFNNVVVSMIEQCLEENEDEPD